MPSYTRQDAPPHTRQDAPTDSVRVLAAVFGPALRLLRYTPTAFGLIKRYAPVEPNVPKPPQAPAEDLLAAWYRSQGQVYRADDLVGAERSGLLAAGYREAVRRESALRRRYLIQRAEADSRPVPVSSDLSPAVPYFLLDDPYSVAACRAHARKVQQTPVRRSYSLPNLEGGLDTPVNPAFLRGADFDGIPVWRRIDTI